MDLRLWIIDDVNVLWLINSIQTPSAIAIADERNLVRLVEQAILKVVSN